MADIQFHFLWPGLFWSIVLSIALSVILTIVLNLFGKRMMKMPEEIEYYNDEEIGEETKTKSSGMILIGPIPIIFGNGGVRFDKRMFGYALLFFLFLLFLYFMFRTVFL